MRSKSMLSEFISVRREEIIRRCRRRAATRSTSKPTIADIDSGVPAFLTQLVEVLGKRESSTAHISRTASLHGHDLLSQGFTLSQVVHEYGDVCQVITELAVEGNTAVAAAEFRLLNQCLDDAIAGAVTLYGRERVQSGIDGESARSTERLGFLAHELRNLTSTAIMAFEALKTGRVGIAGSTGAVLHRSLSGLKELVGRALAEVRLTEALQNPERFQVAGFIDEVSEAATPEATSRRVTLTIDPVNSGVAIDADRQVLAAALGNLLQNAFKFTRPASGVTLRVTATAQRVLIEVQDECGGLPSGDPAELFEPHEQRGADRAGLGLGLAFSRWAVEANHGRVYARNLPSVGCVFTIDMPRAGTAAATA